MDYKSPFHPGLGLVMTCLLLGSMVACNMPQNDGSTPQSVNVTQAYQTVEARLTEAFSQTAIIATTAPATDIGDALETSTQQPIPPTETSPGPAETTVAPSICDQAAPGIPIDVTIPDDTRMQPGQGFTKVWRLKNSGTCTWQTDYQVFLFSGEAMGAPETFALNQQITPGQSVEISVDMTAPQSAGTYQGNWKLRNRSGSAFGIGPSGNSSFWVRIIVVPLPTLTSTPATTTPTPTVTPTEAVQVSGQVTLTPGQTLDLDTNGVNLGSGEDLIYESNPDGNHQLSPLGNVSLALYGDQQPSMAECQAMDLKPEPLLIDKYVGQYICYQTDLGLPGQAQIDYLDPDVYSLRLRILTWLLP